MILPWRCRWLLARGALVWSCLGAVCGFCPRVPMYDLTLALELAAAVGRQTMLALALAAGSGHQGMIFPWRCNWLLSWGAKVGSYLGAGIGCCLGAPRYDLTLVLALAVVSSSTASCTGPAFELHCACIPATQGLHSKCKGLHSSCTGPAIELHHSCRGPAFQLQCTCILAAWSLHSS